MSLRRDDTIPVFQPWRFWVALGALIGLMATLLCLVVLVGQASHESAELPPIPLARPLEAPAAERPVVIAEPEEAPSVRSSPSPSRPAFERPAVPGSPAEL